MKARFLSPEWFDAVSRLAAEFGDLDIPPPLRGLVWNLVIDMPDGSEKPVSMRETVLRPGHADNAVVTMFLEAPLAHQMFVEGNSQAGLMAFMCGDLRLEGDVSMINVMQMIQPSARMTALADKVRELTTP